MSLHAQLLKRQADGKPIRIGLIGAGKFGSMYLAQIPRTPGVHLVGIADLSPDGARRNLARVGWDDAQTRAASLDAAIKNGTHAHRRRLEGAASRIRRSTSSSSAPAIRSPPSSTACSRTPTASTSSTSRSRPMRSAGRCWHGRRPRPASSTRSPSATSRR